MKTISTASEHERCRIYWTPCNILKGPWLSCISYAVSPSWQPGRRKTFERNNNKRVWYFVRVKSLAFLPSLRGKKDCGRKNQGSLLRRHIESMIIDFFFFFFQNQTKLLGSIFQIVIRNEFKRWFSKLQFFKLCSSRFGIYFDKK